MTKKRTPRDYKFIKLLGEGSFSSVYLAVDADVTRARIQALLENSLDESTQNRSSPSGLDTITTTAESNHLNATQGAPSRFRSNLVRKYAIKVCQKSYIKRQNKQVAIMREKEIMNILNQSPNKHFIRLYCTFQDQYRLYFVMTYAENGDLLTYMQEHPLSLDNVRKYTLQLVTALEHIHKLGIVHRDLKPENILLNEQFNILITDFGSAQIYPPSVSKELSANDNSDIKQEGTLAVPMKTESRRNSYVGTAQYVSPEMLKNRQASNKSDLWALGIVIYQMITNVMPFNAPNEYLIYQKIQNLDYNYPEDFDQNARDLVSSLIKLEPTERLGALDDLKLSGYASIRRHRFLIDFANQAPPESDGDSMINKLSHTTDPDLADVDNITPGLDETQLLRLLTSG